jgi:hypothetical protein
VLATKVTGDGTFGLLAGPDRTFMIFGTTSLGSIVSGTQIRGQFPMFEDGVRSIKENGARGKISRAVVERRRRPGYRRVCGHAGGYPSDCCRYYSPYRVERQQRVLSSWQRYPLKRYPSFHRDHQAAATRHARRVLYQPSRPNLAAGRMRSLERFASNESIPLRTFPAHYFRSGAVRATLSVPAAENLVR